VIAGLGLFALAGPAAADDYARAVEQQRTQLPVAAPMDMIAAIAEYPPGAVLRRHRHHGVEMLYVIQGATVQVEGQAPMTLPSGATLMNLRDIPHAGFTVVGTTALRLYTVHVVDQGRPLYDLTAP
jgi:quercetin dioxygenase-like cupin family protein